MTKRKKITRKLKVVGLTPDTPLSFDSPESAIIAAASYDPGQEVLTVQLSQGRGRFRYSVPPRVWLDWLGAESKGSYFSKVIKVEYAGQAEAS